MYGCINNLLWFILFSKDYSWIGSYWLVKIDWMYLRVVNFVKWICFISVNLCVIYFILIFNDNVLVFV